MNKTTLAFTLLLGALPSITMAASLCQPAATSPAANALLAAAQRHLVDAPAPLPHVHTEGTLPNQGIREQSLVAERTGR